jgi:hypothetical protein
MKLYFNNLYITSPNSVTICYNKFPIFYFFEVITCFTTVIAQVLGTKPAIYIENGFCMFLTVQLIVDSTTLVSSVSRQPV